MKTLFDNNNEAIFNHALKIPGIVALGALLYSLVHLLQNPSRPLFNPEFFVFASMGKEIAVVSFATAVLFLLLHNLKRISILFSIVIAVLVIIRPILFLVNKQGDMESFFRIYLHKDNIFSLLWGVGFLLFSLYINHRIDKNNNNL